METVEYLVVGAGPAGLRAAQVLAAAGREVLVADKKPEIGPKTCAGGLTAKTAAELGALGLPDDVSLASVGHMTFDGEPCAVLDPELCLVRTVPRRVLGGFQARWARAAGAEVRCGAPATALDLAGRTAVVGGRPVVWQRLLGADGADSGVRRALGLPSPREYFACEYNVPGARLTPLRIECDARSLANGYFWVFPHLDYTSIGVVGAKHLVPPAALRRYLDARMDALGVERGGVAFEGATLEVDFRGFHFAGDVHLAGDAAGLASALTAEGIYAALVSGEEVARRLLDPAYPMPKTMHWLRVKRRHDRAARLLARPFARAVGFPLLAALAQWRPAKPGLARWCLEA